MENKSFKEILRMIDDACIDVFYTGSKGKEDAVINSAAMIYGAQMNGNIDCPPSCDASKRSEIVTEIIDFAKSMFSRPRNYSGGDIIDTLDRLKKMYEGKIEKK